MSSPLVSIITVVYNAENFVLNFIESKPKFECSIYSHNGQHLKTYDITGERKFANDD